MSTRHSLFKHDWKVLQFTDVWGQIGLVALRRNEVGCSDAIGANCYFEDYTMDDAGDKQRTPWLDYWHQNRGEFKNPKPCGCFDLGDDGHAPGKEDGSKVTANCGSQDNYAYGPLGDPGMGDQASTGWCWWGYDYHGSMGTGSCKGSVGSAYGFQGVPNRRLPPPQRPQAR